MLVVSEFDGNEIDPTFHPIFATPGGIWVLTFIWCFLLAPHT